MKKTIMIVEDDKSILKGIDLILKRKNFQTICISENFSKVAKIAKTKNPNLILMDIQLLKISGIDLIRELKSNPKTTNIPVLALTALTRPEQIKKILTESDCDGYVGKPFQIEDLLNIIEIYLNKK